MSNNNLSRYGSAKNISTSGKDHRTDIFTKRDIPRAISKDLKVPIKGSVNSLSSQPSSTWNLFKIFKNNGSSNALTDASSSSHSLSSNSRSSIISPALSRTSLVSPGGRFTIKAFSISKTTQRLSAGKVMIGSRKGDKQMIEIKRYTKDKVVSERKVFDLLQERFIMEQLRQGNYVTTLRYAFQDDSYAYLLYDLDDFLFTMAIPDSFIIREAVLKNVAAQLAYALKYLHENYIIFNGLRLETICVKNGNLILKDFSKAIYTKKEKPIIILALNMPGKIMPYFLVPELIEREAGWYSIDWWCLGTVLFHLAFGKPLIPPEANLEEIRTIFKALKSKTPHSHLHGIDMEAKSDRNEFINGLLATEPIKRLGSGAGGLGFEKDIKSHRWMTSIDWEDVRGQKIQLKLDYKKLSKKTCRESMATESSSILLSLDAKMYDTSSSYAQKMGERIAENFIQFSIDSVSPPMAFITKEYLKEKAS